MHNKTLITIATYVSLIIQAASAELRGFVGSSNVLEGFMDDTR